MKKDQKNTLSLLGLIDLYTDLAKKASIEASQHEHARTICLNKQVSYSSLVVSLVDLQDSENKRKSKNRRKTSR